jgi:hypothetical protein
MGERPDLPWSGNMGLKLKELKKHIISRIPFIAVVCGGFQ